MSPSGECLIYISNAVLTNLQLHVDMAGPSEPLQIQQSRTLVIQEPYTSQGKRKIKVSEKAR